MGGSDEIRRYPGRTGLVPTGLACAHGSRMDNTVQFIPGQWFSRQTFAGYNNFRFPRTDQRRLLSEFKLELQRVCHALLDFHSVECRKSDLARDECVQFFGVALPVKPGKCVSGEVFERLITVMKLTL